jgi:hypothetical protein
MVKAISSLSDEDRWEDFRRQRAAAVYAGEVLSAGKILAAPTGHEPGERRQTLFYGPAALGCIVLSKYGLQGWRVAQG